MLRVHLAELRDSWPAWAGVSLGILVLNLTFSLSILVTVSGFTEVASGRMELIDSSAFTATPMVTLVLTALVALSVIATSVAMVIDARRGSMARLALAGATPRQVAGTLLGQVMVASIACAVVADVLAVAALQPVLHYLTFEIDAQLEEYVEPRGVISPLWLLAGNLACLAIILLAALRQSYRASRIPPVEALRQAAVDPSQRMTWIRWAAAVLALVPIAGAVAIVPVMAANHTSETVSTFMQLALVSAILLMSVFAALAPRIVGPLARAWTALIPLRDPAWNTARRSIWVRGARFSRSVVPIMFSIGLMLCMLSLGPTILATTSASDLPGGPVRLGGANFGAFISLIGPMLAVAIAGGVGTLIMMSRQRDAELALLGVLGATPAQRIVIPIIEGVILVVTGAILGFASFGLFIGYMAYSFTADGLVFVGALPASAWITALLGTLVIMIAATVLPTLRSLRQPERRVIARLVAE